MLFALPGKHWLQAICCDVASCANKLGSRCIIGRPGFRLVIQRLWELFPPLSHTGSQKRRPAGVHDWVASTCFWPDSASPGPAYIRQQTPHQRKGESINRSENFYLESVKSHPKATQSSLHSQKKANWTLQSKKGAETQSRPELQRAHNCFDRLGWIRNTKKWR